MQRIELTPRTREFDAALRRPTLTRVAVILWGTGAIVFLAAVVVALVIIDTAPATAETAGFALIVFPQAAAMLLGVPLGIASTVLAIVGLVHRERWRPWAIALIAANVAGAVGLYFGYGRILESLYALLQ